MVTIHVVTRPPSANGPVRLVCLQPRSRPSFVENEEKRYYFSTLRFSSLARSDASIRTSRNVVEQRTISTSSQTPGDSTSRRQVRARALHHYVREDRSPSLCTISAGRDLLGDLLLIAELADELGVHRDQVRLHMVNLGKRKKNVQVVAAEASPGVPHENNANPHVEDGALFSVFSPDRTFGLDLTISSLDPPTPRYREGHHIRRCQWVGD